MRIALPEQYQAFAEEFGLFEGFIEGDPGYIQLWAPERLQELNSEILIEEFAPDYLAFASNGANELFVFDSTGAVFMLPLIGMESDSAIRIASSFRELARRFRERA